MECVDYVEERDPSDLDSPKIISSRAPKTMMQSSSAERRTNYSIVRALTLIYSTPWSKIHHSSRKCMSTF